jgi:thiol-disulfide isomerase/thioredoxin
MRNFLCICTFLPFFVSSLVAQDFAQLQKTIDANIAALPPVGEIGKVKPSPELVTACKTIVATAANIYAIPNLDAKDRQWTVQREAVALMVLVYAEPQNYYVRLSRITDDLEQRGLQKLAKETEKHVLEIGGALVTRVDNNPMNLNVQSLAERMVFYANQYPGKESMDIIDNFLLQIYSMKNKVHRDRRLAIAGHIFQDFYKRINHSTKADALDPHISRATLQGLPMLLMGVDINGKEFDPTSTKNKVVLLQFWGTWCVHCKEEMPELIALYEKYHANGFEIIGVNTAAEKDDERRVKQFVETTPFGGKKIPWTILHEGLGASKNKGMTMTKLYGIDELPVLILIGRDGNVLELHPLLSSLDETIAKATSRLAAVEADLTNEQKKQLEEIRRQQREEEDRKIQEELAAP